MAVGKIIRLLRESKNLSQERFAAEFKLTRGKMDTYEREVVSPPAELLNKIADEFGVALTDMYNLSENEFKTKYKYLLMPDKMDTSSFRSEFKKLKQLIDQKDELIRQQFNYIEKLLASHEGHK